MIELWPGGPVLKVESFPAMSRGAHSFKQGDVTKAVKGVLNAGVTSGRVEVDLRTGSIVVHFGGGTAAMTAPGDDANEWDAVAK